MLLNPNVPLEDSMASTDPTSSKPVRKFRDAKTGVFWDVHDYPIPNNLDPISIKQKITDAVLGDGYTGDVSIHLCVDKNKFPDPLLKTYLDAGIQITFLPEDDDDGMFDKMIVGILVWALSNPPPANVMLLSKYLGDETVDSLETLYERDYSVLLSDPPEESHFLPSESLLWLLTSLSDSSDINKTQKSPED